ncbi:copper(I)-binding protein [Rhodopseudomonas julia]|uniref:Copper(I)-binding protein n=1 Tax=Rhodopseudomonas julia TaxID=200617 RepID=A0ABU0C4T5_9BRAD|nr:copper chaperone PCu(A)C [Rhodopseudomonas julia]MDQ0324680.1 copper(I)-binding protein [Rhodopseudomonas julia]
MHKLSLVSLAAAFAAIGLAASPATAQEKHGHAEESGHTESHDDHSHHEAELHGVRLVHAWTRATSGTKALVFVDIQNKSEKNVVLEGGEADIAKTVELVGFQLKDSQPDYVALPKMPVTAGGEVKLSPNGLALRLDGLTQHLQQGDEFQMEFRFDTGHVDMFVQVEAEGAMHHSHVGHTH